MLVLLMACNGVSLYPNTQVLPSVTICNHVWALKNLDVGTYRNGDPIPKVSDNTIWSNLTTGTYCY